MADKKKPPVVNRRKKTSTAIAKRETRKPTTDQRLDNLVLALNSHLGIDLEPTE